MNLDYSANEPFIAEASAIDDEVEYRIPSSPVHAESPISYKGLPAVLQNTPHEAAASSSLFFRNIHISNETSSHNLNQVNKMQSMSSFFLLRNQTKQKLSL